MKKLTHKQQLKLIEALCLIYEDSCKGINMAELAIDEIYKIAHLNGTCKNNHPDWHERGFEMIKEINKSGLTKIKE